MAASEGPETMEHFGMRMSDVLGHPKDSPVISEATAKCLYNILKKHKELPLAPPPMTKLSAKSKHFREEGNRHFLHSRYMQAMISYNKAIAHAPIASEESALAYSNKSAALFHLKQPEACVKDIARALEIGCNESITKKLIERRKKCKNLKCSTTRIPIIQEFKQRVLGSMTKTKPDIPCASDKITIGYDSIKGRKLIANKDFKPGELLAIEKPYAKILDPEKYYTHCYYCSMRSYELIHCEMCSHVMFCSDECKTASWAEYHRYECPIMHYTLGMRLLLQELIGLRIVLKAKAEFGSWAKIREITKQLEAETDPLKRGFVNGVYDVESYATIHVLQRNIGKDPEESLYQFSLSAIVLASLLRDYSEVSAISDEDIYFVAYLIGFNMLGAFNNAFDIEEDPIYRKDIRPGPMNAGAQIYSFMSLLNHSCIPNVVIQTFGKISVMICGQPIDAGQEIYTCYGYWYAICPRNERLEILEERYKFTCQCEACVRKWTSPPMLTVAKDFQKKGVKLYDMKNVEVNRNSVVNTLEKVNYNMSVLRNHEYSAEYNETVHYLMLCWSVIGEELPYDKYVVAYV